MNPVTHLLVSWTVANALPGSRRERVAITLAGLAPDIDGLGLIAEVATRSSAAPLTWYSDLHHVVTHNVVAAVVVGGLCAAVGRRRLVAALGGLLAFHLHLLMDFVGSKGPDGSQWEIVYLWPFTRVWQWTCGWQWELNAWPNFALTAAALALTLYLAWRRGFSPLELVSARADAAFVATLRQRFHVPGASSRP